MAGLTYLTVTRPPTVDPSLEIDAVEVVGDSLHPIPAGWIIFFESWPASPRNIYGRLSVIRVGGNPDAVVGVLEPAIAKGRFNVRVWGGEVFPDRHIMSAHLIAAIQPPDA